MTIIKKGEIVGSMFWMIIILDMSYKSMHIHRGDNECYTCLINSFPCNKLPIEMTLGDSDYVIIGTYLGGVCLNVGRDMSL